MEPLTEGADQQPGGAKEWAELSKVAQNQNRNRTISNNRPPSLDKRSSRAQCLISKRHTVTQSRRHVRHKQKQLHTCTHAHTHAHAHMHTCRHMHPKKDSRIFCRSLPQHEHRIRPEPLDDHPIAQNVLELGRWG